MSSYPFGMTPLVMNGRIGPFVRYHRFIVLSLVTVASKLRLCPCHYSLYFHFASDMFFSPQLYISWSWHCSLTSGGRKRAHVFSYQYLWGNVLEVCSSHHKITPLHRCGSRDKSWWHCFVLALLKMVKRKQEESNEWRVSVFYLWSRKHEQWKEYG